MSDDEFIELVYEVAFGDNAINRDFIYSEVIDQLQRMSRESYRYGEIVEFINSEGDIEDLHEAEARK